MHESWSDRLIEEGQRLFVGRRGEQAELRRLLGHSTARMLYVHGPGGIGKTTLLARFARVAADEGWRSTRIDGRAIAARPDAFERVAAGVRADRGVLIVDSFERLRSLEGWLREVFLPSLPAETRVVVAGRERLSARWSADPGWRALVWSRPLGPFSRRESVEYLAHHGMAPEHADELADSCAGHPLALMLAVHARRERMEHETAAETVTSFLRDLPAEHHEAVAVAALNRFVTPALLGGDDARARERFAWLARQPFVESASLGVVIHDVVRDSLTEELNDRATAWRDELAGRSYDVTCRAIEALAPGPERDAWLDNALALLAVGARGRPEAAAEEWYADRPRASEAEELIAMVRRHFGEPSAAIARHWLEHAWEGAVVGRGSDGAILGFCLFLDVRVAHGPLAVMDPVTLAVAERLPPLELGSEPGALCRFFVTAVAPFQPTRPGYVFVKDEMQRRLMLGGVTFALAAQPSALCERYAELRLHPVCVEVDVAGVPWTVTGHDFRAYKPLAFLRGMLAALRESSAPPPALSRAELEGEVKLALRSFRRADRLAQSRLTGWLGLSGSTNERAEALREVLRDAARALGTCDVDALHHRILDATFFRAAAKQTAVAHDLGMSFSTYRRHLAVAIRRLANELLEHHSGRQARFGAPAHVPRGDASVP